MVGKRTAAQLLKQSPLNTVFSCASIAGGRAVNEPYGVDPRTAGFIIQLLLDEVGRGCPDVQILETRLIFGDRDERMNAARKLCSRISATQFSLMLTRLMEVAD